jgi:UTP:GlnB (protein PII) uridylyltransferase
MDASPTPTAEQVIATLRDHAAELRQAGVRHVSLFGSLARGEASPASDIDLVVELDRGMGNRLRHAYDRLSLPVIWHAIQDELPTLEADVRLALIAAQLNRQG